MLSKNDLILILSELEETQNIDATKMITDLISSKSIPLNVVKFINDRRPLAVTNFYEHIRKSYN